MGKKAILFGVMSLLLVILSCEKNNELFQNSITVEKDSISFSSSKQSLRLTVVTQTDFNVSSNSDWLKVVKSYSDKESYIELNVEENTDSLSSRECIITLSSVSSDAIKTITVTQSFKNVITLLTSQKELSSDQQDISIPFRHNCDYNIIIPETAKDWIFIKNSTKAMTESAFELSISKNDSYDRRKASIIICNITDGIQDTLHLIQDEGFNSLRILLRDNPQTTIFYKALEATHLADSLILFEDLSYPTPAYDSTFACLKATGKSAYEYETAYETGNSRQRAVWPDKRLFKFTVFAVTDSILNNIYGISSLNDLRLKAIEEYGGDNSIPDSSSISPLYKLMSYHILPCWLPYDQLNISQKEFIDNRKKRDSLDVEDFYETLHPYAIMRISTPLDAKVEKKGIYINRKGTVTANNLTHKGIRIWSASEYEKIDNICSNGGFHYVDSLLFFNSATKSALNVRMRVMANTLSPDFINSGARGRLRTYAKNPFEYAVYGFKRGYCRNVECSEESQFYVGYRDPTFGCLYGEQMTIRGDYDIIFRLPPVPEDGRYEIRVWGNSLGNSCQNDRGIVQFSISEGRDNFRLCGPPVDMSIKNITDPYYGIGAIMDVTIRWSYNYATEEEIEAAIAANDKLMREHGYMKAMDSYGAGSNILRNDQSCFRKIVCEDDFKAETDYYLRLTKYDDLENTVIPFNFVEIVPYSVYSGENGPEDRH